MFLVALASIYSLHLLDTTDSQKRYSITFVVVTGPARDRLLLKEDQHLVDVVNFTKAQVDEGSCTNKPGLTRTWAPRICSPLTW